MAEIIEASRRFPLERGGPERLELRWTASFREVTVLFDGGEVTKVDRPKIPRDGATVALPDGSTLTIRLNGLLGMGVARNGVPLPGSDLEPRRLLRNAAMLMGLAALLDTASDGVLARRARALSVGLSVPFPREHVYRLALDGALVTLAIATAFGTRVGLALGVAAFAARFGVAGERSTWTAIYGVFTTWLLATHFFATFGPRTRKTTGDADPKPRA